MCSVAIQNWAITILDLAWMVKNNNLSNEFTYFLWWIVLFNMKYSDAINLTGTRSKVIVFGNSF